MKIRPLKGSVASGVHQQPRRVLFIYAGDVFVNQGEREKKSMNLHLFSLRSLLDGLYLMRASFVVHHLG